MEPTDNDALRLQQELTQAYQAHADASATLQKVRRESHQKLQESLLQAKDLSALQHVRRAAERNAATSNNSVLDSICKQHNDSADPHTQTQVLACLSERASTHPFSVVWAAAQAQLLPHSMHISLVSLGASIPCLPPRFPAAIFLYHSSRPLTGTEVASSGGKDASSCMTLLILDAKDSHIKADLYIHQDVKAVVSMHGLSAPKSRVTL